MAREIVEMVTCDRCHKKLEGPSRHTDSEGIEPKFHIQVLKVVGDAGDLQLVDVASYFDLCDSCDVYVRKQLDYILLMKKRGRKPKSKTDKAPKKVKRSKKEEHTAPFPSTRTEDRDVAKVID